MQRGPTVLSEDDLLAVDLGVDPLQITLDETPRSQSSSGLGAEKWQHVESDEVNGVQNGLSPAVGLETVSHFGNSDKDAEGGKILLGGLDLGSEVAGGQDVIVQGFGTELDGPGNELGLGVIVEDRKEAVPASLPHVAPIKAELGWAKG